MLDRDDEPDYGALEREEFKHEDPLLSGEDNDLLTSEFDDEVMQDASYERVEPNREVREKTLKVVNQAQPRLVKAKSTNVKTGIPRFQRPQTAKVSRG